MDYQQMMRTLTDTAVHVALKVVGAILLWAIGYWLIKMAIRLVRKAFQKKDVDKTLQQYLFSTISVVLNAALIVAILGYLGVETTSFAALLAAGGVAIGVAWSGLLANFAAGVFLLFLRPFKVGDFITAGGVNGTVMELGLFLTLIDTPDHIRTYVGNNKIFSDNIQNFSANRKRRIDLRLQLHYSVDPNKAMEVLKQEIERVPGVLKNPPTEISIFELSPTGPILAVRPYCDTNDYWAVYFAVNRTMLQIIDEMGYPVAEQHFVLRRPSRKQDGEATKAQSH